jgi:hypothetical protein
MAAVRSIMGHAPLSGDMSAAYRERIDDSRLLAVTEHVRKWLFGKVMSRIKCNTYVWQGLPREFDRQGVGADVR